MNHFPFVSRRTLLQAGAIGTRLGWPLLMQSQLQGNTERPQSGPLAGFGRAKRCLFLFMWGGPSHLDTLDLKPNAPKEVRGDFSPIPTNVPGIEIGEHFPLLSERMNHFTLIRSLTHDDPAHLSSAHTMLTGHLPPVNKSDAEPPSDRDSPHVGCLMSRLHPNQSGMPSFVTMPWLAYHPAAPGGRAPGQHSGWLGHRYDPMLITGDPSRPDWSVPTLTLQQGLSLNRLDRRKSLLSTLEQSRGTFTTTSSVRQMNNFQQRAFELLHSSKVRSAFDLTQETNETRDRYGRHIHGQCVLLARRLLERDVPLVSVNWHNDGKNFWDTHGNNFNRLKNDLIPPADRALSAILDDLKDRNLLQETLIVWVGEFGRKPHISKNNAGREHWPFCYSGLLGGAGIQGGSLYGSSDAQGAYPKENPVSPHEFAATVFHALGIDHQLTLKDSLQRPHRIYPAKPLTQLW